MVSRCIERGNPFSIKFYKNNFYANRNGHKFYEKLWSGEYGGCRMIFHLIKTFV